MSCCLRLYSGDLLQLNQATDSVIKSKGLKIGLTWEI